jgi:MFS family permease
MLIVFLVVFIDLLGFGIVLPLLPRYVQTFTAGMSDLAGGLVIGSLFSVFSLMTFLVAPVWGRLSDRVGRRPVILVGLAGSVAFYALFGYASTFGPDRAGLGLALMFASRIGAGITSGTISTAAAVIADSTSRDDRAKGMALIGAAFGIGFTFGPLIAYFGETLFPDELSGPGFLAATISAIALALAWRLLPETNRGRAGHGSGDPYRLHGLWSALRSPGIGILVVCFFLATFGFANFEATLSMLTQTGFAFTVRQNYLVFAYVGASLMIAQGLIYRRLIGRFGELRMTRAGLVLMLLGLANLAGVAATAVPRPGGVPPGMLAWFLAALFVAVCGYAFLNPSVNALISKRAAATRQGEILGVNQSASALARILGPAVGWALFPLTPRHELPYVVAAALLLVVLALSPRMGGDAV